MKIAELFVKLGVDGTKDVQKGLEKTDKRMGAIVTRALAVTAAMAAAGAALYKFTKTGTEEGQGLLNFANATGLSVKKLQQFQYAGKQAGIAASEVQGSIKSLQMAYANMRRGMGGFEGFAEMAQFVKLDEKKAGDPFYLILKMQEFAQKSIDKAHTRAVLSTAGMSASMIDGIMGGVFNEKNLNAAKVLSGAEIQNLNKIKNVWGNLAHDFDRAMAKLNGKHGLVLAKSLRSLIEPVKDLTEAFAEFISKHKVIEQMAAGIAQLAKYLNGETSYQQLSTGEKWDNFAKNGWFNLTRKEGEKGKSVFDASEYLKNKNLLKEVVKDVDVNKRLKEIYNNNTINQNINLIHDGKSSPQEVGRGAKRGIEEAAGQISNKGQVN